MDVVDNECQPHHKVYLPFIVSLKAQKKVVKVTVYLQIDNFSSNFDFSV